ncbi:MAG: tetratricopeptide repeat protein [Planctomycetota bacterium]
MIILTFIVLVIGAAVFVRGLSELFLNSEELITKPLAGGVGACLAAVLLGWWVDTVILPLMVRKDYFMGLGLVMVAAALYSPLLWGPFTGGLFKMVESMLWPGRAVKPAKVYEKAEMAMSAGRLEEAAALYRAEGETDENDVEAWYRLADVQLAMKKPREAFETFRRVVVHPHANEGYITLCAKRVAELAGIPVKDVRGLLETALLAVSDPKLAEALRSAVDQLDRLPSGDLPKNAPTLLFGKLMHK